MDRAEIEKEARKLIKDKSWKSPAIIGGLCLVLLIIVNSILFDLAIGLIKLILALLGIGLLARAVWLGYPAILKKYEEEKKDGNKN